MLSSVCYEQIKDDYWYGLYGDFKLIINKRTSRFNATKLCKDGGKRFDHWMANDQSKTLINHITLLRTQGDGSSDGSVMDVVMDGDNLLRGTYVPQELILSIASWVSPTFYLKCNAVVMDHYTDYFKANYDSLGQKLEEVTNLMEQMKVRVSLMREDVVPKPTNPNKIHMFVLIHKNVDEEYPYYVVRAQHCSFKKAMDTIKAKYPKNETIYQLEYNPNTVNLFVRMKETIKTIKTSFNNIKLDEGYSIDDLVMDIKNLCPFGLCE